jgi:hypothetical protein
MERARCRAWVARAGGGCGSGMRAVPRPGCGGASERGFGERAAAKKMARERHGGWLAPAARRRRPAAARPRPRPRGPAPAARARARPDCARHASGGSKPRPRRGSNAAPAPNIAHCGNTWALRFAPQPAHHPRPRARAPPRGRRAAAMASQQQAPGADGGVSLGKGAWDCDAQCEIPPEKEVRARRGGGALGLGVGPARGARGACGAAARQRAAPGQDPSSPCPTSRRRQGRGV